ncbi:type III secretion system co-regulatory protein PtrC [Pseudomonas alcaligenes]|uniref:type III secretion system co-regulatory protein PtrC n=1 Tax=Aquipseudomonas alcaligenes TaxID=43263 RepID=UPI00358F1A14
MSITEAFASRNSYGVTYVNLDDTGLHFESEAAVHMDDGSLLTLRMPTRHSEKLDIHALLCQQYGGKLAA